MNSLASRIVAIAKRINRPFLVAGLNSFERRIIHRAMDSTGVFRTEGLGYGSFRKLRIDPES